MSRKTWRCTSVSRTTPFRTWSRPASNCGLTSTTARHGAASTPNTAGSTSRSEMNDTSAVANVGRNGRSSAVSERALRRSITVTRGSATSRSCSWFRPTSTAATRAAPWASRQSVKPPVEAPTSRHDSPRTSIPNRVRPVSSLSPPRRRTAALDQLERGCSRGRSSGLGDNHAVQRHPAGHDQTTGAAASVHQTPLHEGFIETGARIGDGRPARSTTRFGTRSCRPTAPARRCRRPPRRSSRGRGGRPRCQLARSVDPHQIDVAGLSTGRVGIQHVVHDLEYQTELGREPAVRLLALRGQPGHMQPAPDRSRDQRAGLEPVKPSQLVEVGRRRGDIQILPVHHPPTPAASSEVTAARCSALT